MSETVKFGRQAVQRPPFQINELTFASTPLSLAEEQQLAATGESGDEVLDALLDVLAHILNQRVSEKGATVNADWLKENLAPDDLEGIVEFLRSGQVVGE